MYEERVIRNFRLRDEILEKLKEIELISAGEFKWKPTQYPDLLEAALVFFLRKTEQFYLDRCTESFSAEASYACEREVLSQWLEDGK